MPADPLGVRGACRQVVEEALEVRIGSVAAAVTAVAQLEVPAWDNGRHYGGDRLVEYVLVLDTLNFSFWGSDRGYWELAESLARAFAAGDPLWDCERLLALDEGSLRELVGKLPILAERLAALHELADLAIREADGSLAGLVPPSATELAGYLSDNLASYRDIVYYGERPIPLLKRAQIAAADLWGSGAIAFPDVEDLTCFADYKLPQVLHHLGALEYTEHLSSRIERRIELEAGSPEEVEIRAATIVAVEKLRDQLAGEGRRLTAVEVDWLLWGLAQTTPGMAPYHRVRTIFY